MCLTMLLSVAVLLTPNHEFSLISLRCPLQNASDATRAFRQKKREKMAFQVQEKTQSCDRPHVPEVMDDFQYNFDIDF